MAEQVDTATARASHSSILNTIAGNAMDIASLAKRAADDAPDAAAVGMYCSAVEVLACRIGWMAEVANAELGERIGVVGTDARDWLMPSLYQRPEAEVPSHG